MDRKGSSHVGSPDYDTEITHHIVGALAIFEERMYPWRAKIGLMKSRKKS
jgi:hypothetical protein